MTTPVENVRTVVTILLPNVPIRLENSVIVVKKNRPAVLLMMELGVTVVTLAKNVAPLLVIVVQKQILVVQTAPLEYVVRVLPPVVMMVLVVQNPAKGLLLPVLVVTALVVKNLKNVVQENVVQRTNVVGLTDVYQNVMMVLVQFLAIYVMY